MLAATRTRAAASVKKSEQKMSLGLLMNPPDEFDNAPAEPELDRNARTRASGNRLPAGSAKRRGRDGSYEFELGLQLAELRLELLSKAPFVVLGEPRAVDAVEAELA